MVNLSPQGPASAPWFRVTRCSLLSGRRPSTPPGRLPRDRLPLLRGGFFEELIYGDQPRLFHDLVIPADDPAAEYLEGMSSVVAVPMFDGGEGLNMTVLMRQEPRAFAEEQLPEIVWTSNLYGRATHNLVLSERLRQAYEAVDHELRVVADNQRSLLPAQMPSIPTMSLAAHYQTSRRAGGDYYDFFSLPDGRWGLLIADVSGHGTPAAVLMAVTHSLAHSYPNPSSPPGALLSYVNGHLTDRYTASSDTFVTAFYGVYDPAARTLTYSSAGHNPPRLTRCDDGSLALLDKGRGMPLGIFAAETYPEATHQLRPGDQLIFYTDEEEHHRGPLARGRGDVRGGVIVSRLDRVLENCSVTASDLLRTVLSDLEEFTGGAPPHDDRTLLVAKIT